jgi:hypothetical protein
MRRQAQSLALVAWSEQYLRLLPLSVPLNGRFAPEVTCRAFINAKKWSLVIE